MFSKIILFIISILYLSLSYSFGNIKEDSITFYEQTLRLSTKDTQKVEPKITIQLGAFHAYSQSSLLVQNGDKGTTIDPHEDLNFKDASLIPKGEIIYEPGKRHEINFIFWSARRTATKTLKGDIFFKGLLFPENSIVKSDLDITNFTLIYRYALFKRNNLTVGLSSGAKLFDFRTKLSITGLSASNNSLGPGPLFGIHGKYVPFKILVLRATGDYFQISLNEWDYKSLDVKAGFEFFPIRRVGLGMDYHHLDLIFKRARSNSNRNFHFKFDAVSVFLSVRI